MKLILSETEFDKFIDFLKNSEKIFNSNVPDFETQNTIRNAMFFKETVSKLDFNDVDNFLTIEIEGTNYKYKPSELIKSMISIIP